MLPAILFYCCRPTLKNPLHSQTAEPADFGLPYWIFVGMREFSHNFHTVFLCNSLALFPEILYNRCRFQRNRNFPHTLHRCGNGDWTGAAVDWIEI